MLLLHFNVTVLMQMTCVLNYEVNYSAAHLFSKSPQGIILLGSYLFSAKGSLNLLNGHI